VRVLHAGLGEDPRDGGFRIFRGHARPDGERAAAAKAFDHERKPAEVRRQHGCAETLAVLRVNEHRTRRGQAAHFRERLIREEESVLLADREGPQAQATRPVALRALAMCRMSVLGRALSPARFIGERGGNAGVSKATHE
jgi:hypothetical protein